MNKTITITVFILSLLFSTKTTLSQIILSDEKKLDILKGSVTYFFYETDDNDFKPYRDAIDSAWTISEIKYTTKGLMKSVIKDNVFFIEMSDRTKEHKLTDRREGNIIVERILVVKIPTITFWYASDCENGSCHKNVVATIDLYENPFDPTNSNCNPKLLTTNHFLNIKPGYLKNYLQFLQTCLLSEQKMTEGKNIINKSELGKMKKDTLFVPKYTLKGQNYKNLRPKEGEDVGLFEEPRDIDLIFKNYKYAYKSISDKKLSNKIITSGKPVYYLLFVMADNVRYVCVFNSKTGEMIYSHRSFPNTFKRRLESLTLMDDDIDKLLKEIE